jgi:hypothetical protein
MPLVKQHRFNFEARTVPKYVGLDNSPQNGYNLFKVPFKDYVTMTNQVLWDVTPH